MADWRAELAAFIAEASVFTQTLAGQSRSAGPAHVSAPPTLPEISEAPNAVEAAAPPPIIPEPIKQTNARSLEREDIKKRVENFKAHQQRIAREREEYAASMMARMRAAAAGQAKTGRLT